MTKRSAWMAITILVSLPAATPVWAAYSAAQELHFEPDRSVEKKLALMTKKLSLTPDQSFHVKQALEDEATKMELLRKDYLEQKKKIADDTNGAFMSILNPSQQEGFLKIKQDVLGKPDALDAQPQTNWGDRRGN